MWRVKLEYVIFGHGSSGRQAWPKMPPLPVALNCRLWTWFAPMAVAARCSAACGSTGVVAQEASSRPAATAGQR